MGKKYPTCPFCKIILIDKADETLPGWKKCLTCGWCEDKEGKNQLFPDGYKEPQADSLKNLLKRYLSK